jgi:ABC-2 type transport system permease protein
MTAVVLVAAFLFQNIAFGAGAYLLTIVAVICSSAVFLSIGQALVGLVTSTDTINAVGRVLYIPLVALGIFARATVFGTTIETIARWSPAGVVSSLLIGAMEPSTWSSDTWWSLLACAGYAIVFATIGIRYFRWTTR